MRKKMGILLLTVVSICSASAQAKEVNSAIFAIRSGILANLLAKEICSCVFATGAFDRLGKSEALKRCLHRASLPVSEDLLHKIVDLTIVDDSTIRIDPKTLSFIAALKDLDPAIAVYHRDTPQYGCSLKFD